VSEAEDDDDEDFRTTIIGNWGDFSNLPRGVDMVVGNQFGQKNSGGQMRPSGNGNPQWRPRPIAPKLPQRQNGGRGVPVPM